MQWTCKDIIIGRYRVEMNNRTHHAVYSYVAYKPLMVSTYRKPDCPERARCSQMPPSGRSIYQLPGDLPDSIGLSANPGTVTAQEVLCPHSGTFLLLIVLVLLILALIDRCTCLCEEIEVEVLVFTRSQDDVRRRTEEDLGRTLRRRN
nr:hypothetical protein PsAHV6-067 [Psittacid alphaherpesvirus 6]